MAIDTVFDASTLVEQPYRDMVTANDVADMVLRTTRSIVFDRYARVPKLGRFVIVDGPEVAGGGTVTRAVGARVGGAEVVAANLSWSPSRVTAEERHHRNRDRGAVVWFTGLSGSGKSTIATALERELFDRGCQVFVLDGDNIRHGLTADLGFSEADRSENIRRVAEVAKLFGLVGFIVVVAFISPSRVDRARAREIVGRDVVFAEVFLEVPLETCERRDPKGLYAKARQGAIRDFTGISAPYDRPESPELVLRTGEQTAEEAVAVLGDYLRPLVLMTAGRRVDFQRPPIASTVKPTIDVQGRCRRVTNRVRGAGKSEKPRRRFDGDCDDRHRHGVMTVVRTIRSDEVHLYCSLTQQLEAEDVVELAMLLSEDERARAARFAFYHDRRDYVAAHALLRRSLSCYAGVGPSEWVFEPGEYGKPRIVAIEGVPPLTFNLSHTQGCVTCVVATVDVGVDVEGSSSRIALADIAERFFAAFEVAELSVLADTDQPGRFVELWTLKEAYLKAVGCGLSRNLDSFGFTFPAPGLTRFASQVEDRGTWNFALLALDDYRFGVAARAVTRSTRTRSRASYAVAQRKARKEPKNNNLFAGLAAFAFLFRGSDRHHEDVRSCLSAARALSDAGTRATL